MDRAEGRVIGGGDAEEAADEEVEIRTSGAK